MAQPKDFGKVSKNDLTQSFSRSDSNFNVLALFDFAELEIMDEMKYRLIRHQRLKILTPNGIRFGDFVLAYNEEDYGQKFDEIKGFTFNLSNNGKVEKTKLEDDQIFEQDDIAQWKTVKFTMPNLREGSIIDVRYEKVLGGPEQIPNWYFDNAYPTKRSEFIAEIPLYLRFSLLQRVTREFDTKEVKQTKSSIRYTYNENSGSYSNSRKQRLRLSSPTEKFHWVMKDVPGIPYEPYVSSIENHRSFIFLQYKGIEMPNYNIKDIYTESWNKVAKTLLESDGIGGRIAVQAWSQDMARSLTEGLETREQQIESLFRYVNSFNTNDTYSIYSSNSMEDINNDKSGTPTELNLLLIKLLRSIGVNANPVLLSTKENGKILKEYVLPDQFNKIITNVRAGGETYLLDPSGENKTALLPIENINGEGLELISSSPVWIPLEDGFSTSTEIEVNAQLKPSGNIDGVIELSMEGYDAAAFEKNYQEDSLKTVSTYIFRDQNRNTSFDSTYFQRMTFSNPKIDYYANFSQKNSLSKDSLESIYINFAGFEFLNLIPLENQSRRLPIEFPYPAARSIKFKIDIPDGYAVEKLPDGEIISVPNSVFNYVDSYMDFGNSVLIERRFIAYDTRFSPNIYPVIKNIYDNILNPTRTIVITKK